MKPNILILDGFTGIKNGRGVDSITLDLTTIPSSAQLVALTGPNGNGKTTLMDNLHPYRLMPSRSTTLGPGGFSYWDHIDGPTAQKIFQWEHLGIHYKTVFTFKSTAKTRKADWYLYQLEPSNDGLWKPVELPDGTRSDGKAETYDACIDAVLGAPEAFFTTNFSAQKRKAISAYGSSEIKALLASVLEHGHLQVLSAKAAEVARLLRFHLNGLQDKLAQGRVAEADLTQAKANLLDVQSSLAAAEANEQQASVALDDARKALVVVEGRIASQTKDDEERAFLLEQIRGIEAWGNTQRTKIHAAVADETAAANGELQKLRLRLSQDLERQQSDEKEILRLTAILQKEKEITHACAEVPKLQKKIAAVDAEIKASKAKVEELRPLRQQVQQDNESMARIHAKAGGQLDTIESLKRTASLIDEVPCANSMLSGQCPLLANAHKARGEVEAKTVEVHDLRMQYNVIIKRVKADVTKVEELDTLERRVNELAVQRAAISDELAAMSQRCAQQSALTDARQRLPELKSVLQACLESQAGIKEQYRTTEDTLAAIPENRDKALVAVETQAGQEVSVLRGRLALLPVPITNDQLAAARDSVDQAIQTLNTVKANHAAMRSKKEAQSAQIASLESVLRSCQAAQLEEKRVSAEIANWKLLDKGLGNEGLIALSIDDAGPSISALCNSLLHECYDRRFAIRIETQTSTQKGDLRETFDVIVQDQHTGKDKSLKDMSPGECTWVNESLTRAIALYVAQSKGVTTQTLFTDETDGPLDPNRKRQFMRMKRTVLERGGYEREYFISQTPELWEMADHVIDVTML
jgi:exonuclease SbcC